MQLRPYTNADFPAVVLAMESFQSYLASIDPLQLTRCGKDFDAAAYTKLCVEQAQAPNALFLLAVEGSELLGFLVAAPRKTTKKDAEDEKPNPKAEVLELFVHEGHRSKKIGFSLMQAAEKHFKALGCTLLVVECFAPNALAHHFYERYGFADRMITMSKRI